MTFAQPSPVRWRVVARNPQGGLLVVELDGIGAQVASHSVGHAALPEFVDQREGDSVPAARWVWADTTLLYPGLLAAGVRIERCHDLRLCHQILAGSALVTDRRALIDAAAWAVSPDPPVDTPADDAPALFGVEDLERRPRRDGVPESIDDVLAEFARQREAVKSASDPGRLSLLLAAESAGALIAAELAAAGVPWDAGEHDRILAALLGPRPAPGAKPIRMLAAADATRRALGDPTANLDSHTQLLRALRAAGIEASSTSQWELTEFEHPAIAPLLEYKKLARLLSANGWAWLDEWVRDGRYRPVYVPGGVVTGRWASSGGGALQMPRQLRPALRADPGWILVSADVSQLEPRVLAAMSGDPAMAAAGAGKDLYEGIVRSGAVATRQEAKLAVLGAMYGSTSGDSGRLVPRLRRAFPAAMKLVDDAAAVGERGGIVSTWLGRSSPEPDDEWHALQAAASMPGAARAEEDLARRISRERGRFTRNFVVQGTAAEWALTWMAELRMRLAAFDPLPVHGAAPGTLSDDAVASANATAHATSPAHAAARAEATGQAHATGPAHASGPVFARRPHLAFFLHDEVIVHTPQEHADDVAAAVVAAAQSAGQRLFAQTAVDFKLDLQITERAQKD